MRQLTAAVAVFASMSAAYGQQAPYTPQQQQTLQAMLGTWDAEVVTNRPKTFRLTFSQCPDGYCVDATAFDQGRWETVSRTPLSVTPDGISYVSTRQNRCDYFRIVDGALHCLYSNVERTISGREIVYRKVN